LNKIKESGFGKEKSMERPSWPDFFMNLAKDVSTRSTCKRRQIGAVLVRENQIISTGYNGAPTDIPHCIEVGCMRDEMNIESGTHHELCMAVHAEQNAIIQAAKHGHVTKGCTMYCTTMPCAICTKMIINAGIVEVYFNEGYPDQLTERIVKQKRGQMYTKEQLQTYHDSIMVNGKQAKSIPGCLIGEIPKYGHINFYPRIMLNWP
jgi:dCMP deaminase